MKLPMGLTVALGRGAFQIAKTWRFRQIGDPGERPDPRDGPVIYAFWHEHLLPLAALHANEGIRVLVSRHRDGEIISRLVLRLGYETVRGSSTRGGPAALLEMIRAGQAGHTLAFTPDGPRGPRRRCKPGVIKAAAETGLPIIPVSIAVRRGVRLDSWDRFLIPAPGAMVYASYGPPMWVSDTDPASEARAMQQLERALAVEVKRCEAHAPGAPAVEASQSKGIQRNLEARARISWRGSPGPLLRGTEALFATGVEIRHFLYDAGVLARRPAPLPVVSVGGLTVGGSGKTPLTAEVARWLQDDGHIVGILTRGYSDEMALHRSMTPGALVLGHPERRVAATAATDSGATVAVLDDGFQHKRLARNLEIVVLDLDAVRRTNRRRLPAGPFRESFRALGRADIVVLSRRDASGNGGAELGDWIERRFHTIIARCTLQPGDLVEVNGAARRCAEAYPAFALTGIMKPNLFFEQVAHKCPRVVHYHALPDHVTPTDKELERVIAEAGSRGVVTTGKDVPGIESRVPEQVPLWFLSETIVWEAGRDSLRKQVRELRSG
jgi:lysophospholipid acyltransferase (LPLAT)-like uncharacterized protein/tetraacyldisaccharide-1-P 4'-kinase